MTKILKVVIKYKSTYVSTQDDKIIYYTLGYTIAWYGFIVLCIVLVSSFTISSEVYNRIF